MSVRSMQMYCETRLFEGELLIYSIGLFVEPIKVLVKSATSQFPEKKHLAVVKSIDFCTCFMTY